MTVDNEMTADLLLGKLPEEQRIAMERQFFADAELFDELLIAENELTDAYAAGRLTDGDRALFERIFLLAPMQRQRVAFADALIKYAARTRNDVAVQDNAIDRSWASLSSLFSTRRLAFSFAAAGLAVAILSMFLLFSQPRHVSESDVAVLQARGSEVPAIGSKEVEQPTLPVTGNSANAKSEPGPRITVDRKPAPPARPAALVSTIILAIGSTRGTAGSRTYTLPAQATGVRLRLAIEDRTFSSYIAVVETVEGRQIASQKASRSGDSVSIVVPASRLKKGDYIVTLKAAKQSGVPTTIGEYSFSVD